MGKQIEMVVNEYTLKGNSDNGDLYIVEDRINGPYTVGYWGEDGFQYYGEPSPSVDFIQKVGDQLFYSAEKEMEA